MPGVSHDRQRSVPESSSQPDQHKMRRGEQPPAPVQPEQVARLVMRENDFAALLTFLNQRAADYEAQTGRKLGSTP